MIMNSRILNEIEDFLYNIVNGYTNDDEYDDLIDISHDIGFEKEGIRIIDPFMSINASDDLSYSQACDYYGKEIVDKYLELVKDYMVKHHYLKLNPNEDKDEIIGESFNYSNEQNKSVDDITKFLDNLGIYYREDYDEDENSDEDDYIGIIEVEEPIDAELHIYTDGYVECYTDIDVDGPTVDNWKDGKEFIKWFSDKFLKDETIGESLNEKLSQEQKEALSKIRKWAKEKGYKTNNLGNNLHDAEDPSTYGIELYNAPFELELWIEESGVVDDHESTIGDYWDTAQDFIDSYEYFLTEQEDVFIGESIHKDINLGWSGKGHRHPMDASDHTPHNKGDIIKVTIPSFDLEYEVKDGYVLDDEAQEDSPYHCDRAAELVLKDDSNTRDKFVSNIKNAVRDTITKEMIKEPHLTYYSGVSGDSIPLEAEINLGSNPITHKHYRYMNSDDYEDSVIGENLTEEIKIDNNLETKLIYKDNKYKVYKLTQTELDKILYDNNLQDDIDIDNFGDNNLLICGIDENDDVLTFEDDNVYIIDLDDLTFRGQTETGSIDSSYDEVLQDFINFFKKKDFQLYDKIRPLLFKNLYKDVQDNFEYKTSIVDILNNCKDNSGRSDSRLSPETCADLVDDPFDLFWRWYSGGLDYSIDDYRDFSWLTNLNEECKKQLLRLGITEQEFKNIIKNRTESKYSEDIEYAVERAINDSCLNYGAVQAQKDVIEGIKNCFPDFYQNNVSIEGPNIILKSDINEYNKLVDELFDEYIDNNLRDYNIFTYTKNDLIKEFIENNLNVSEPYSGWAEFDHNEYLNCLEPFLSEIDKR